MEKPEIAIGHKDDFVEEVTEELLEQKPELVEQGVKIGQIVPDYNALAGKHVDGETGFVFENEEDFLDYKYPNRNDPQILKEPDVWDEDKPE